MPRIYCAANPSTLAYVIDGGGSGYEDLPLGRTIMQAEYLAVIYGLNSFFIKWQKELDARYDNIDGVKVGTPADRTKRPLPPPILICLDDELVVKQMSRQHHIVSPELRKLAQQVWQMTKELDITFQWTREEENLARRMLE